MGVEEEEVGCERQIPLREWGLERDVVGGGGGGGEIATGFLYFRSVQCHSVEKKNYIHC